MNGRRKFLGLSLITFLSACAVSGLESKNSSSVNLMVSAASSLQDVITDLGNLYRQQMPHVQLTYNFGSSGSLRRQIEQGAPVDVYISAAEQHMDSLEQENLLLDNTRRNLLQNELVLITAQNNTKVAKFSQLPSNAVNKIAIGDPDSVPAGKYAKEVLDSLQLSQSLAAKFVYAKDVRQVLAYVETGNVEAGLVYRTDAQISKQVRILATAPANSHAPIIYPVAIVRHSKQTANAQDFIQFLMSNDAQKIFANYGFVH